MDDSFDMRSPAVAARYTVTRVLLLLVMFCPTLTSGQSNRVPDQDPPLLNNLKTRNDKLRFDRFVTLSTVEAERFRRSLLAESNLLASTIGVACVRFRDSGEVAEFAQQSSYDLSRFVLDHLQIRDAMAGTRDVPNPDQFYGAFAGKWFGRWADSDVDHHWGKYIQLDPPEIVSIDQQESVTLRGYQYAWVGDGYGLNHVASSPDGKRKFLLGYVVHIRDHDPTQEIVRRPHVGVIDGPDRLIWITRSEVFFEELIRGKTSAEDRYFITGFRYSVKDGILSADEAFQTVYSRDAEHRLPWRGRKLEMKVSPPVEGGLGTGK